MARGVGSLELKVGVFVVITAVVLGAFVLVLGNFRFTPAHELHVTFPVSGGLRDGAKVKIAGVNAGRVKEVQFVGGTELDPEGNRIWVKVLLEVDRDKAVAITSSSRYYITAEGMLGEKYVEISPGSGAGTPVPSGSAVQGEPVLEMHVATERALEVFSKVEAVLGDSSGDLSAIVTQTRSAVESSQRILVGLEKEIPLLVQELREVVRRGNEVAQEAGELAREGRTWMKDPALRSTIDGVQHSVNLVEQRLPALVDHLDETVQETLWLVQETRERAGRLETELTESAAQARRHLARLDSNLRSLDASQLMDSVQNTLDRTTRDLAATAASVKDLADRSGSLVGELAGLVEGVKKGRGTLGAFLVSREVYDDVRELILDLKRHPWKVLWKP